MEALIQDNNISPRYKVRLVTLYALRYQKTKANDIANLINLMLQNGVKREDARVSLAVSNPQVGLTWILSIARIRVLEHRWV